MNPTMSADKTPPNMTTIPPMNTGANSFVGMLAISESIVEMSILLDDTMESTESMLRCTECRGCSVMVVKGVALRQAVALLLPTKAARDDETSASKRKAEMRILDMMMLQLCNGMREVRNVGPAKCQGEDDAKLASFSLNDNGGRLKFPRKILHVEISRGIIYLPLRAPGRRRASTRCIMHYELGALQKEANSLMVM
jgi:hypothetical protein